MKETWLNKIKRFFYKVISIFKKVDDVVDDVIDIYQHIETITKICLSIKVEIDSHDYVLALRKLNELDEYINNLDLKYIPEVKAIVTKLVDYIELALTSKEHIEGFKKLMDQSVEKELLTSSIEIIDNYITKYTEEIVPEFIADNIKNNNFDLTNAYNDLFGKYKENKFVKHMEERERILDGKIRS